MGEVRLREQVLRHLSTVAVHQEKVEVRQREQVFLLLVGEEQMDVLVLQLELSVALLVVVGHRQVQVVSLLVVAEQGVAVPGALAVVDH